MNKVRAPNLLVKCFIYQYFLYGVIDILTPLSLVCALTLPRAKAQGILAVRISTKGV